MSFFETSGFKEFHWDDSMASYQTKLIEQTEKELGRKLTGNQGDMQYVRETHVKNSQQGVIAVPPQYDLNPEIIKFQILHRGKASITFPTLTGAILENYEEVIVTPSTIANEEARSKGTATPRGYRIGVRQVPEGTVCFSAEKDMYVIKRVADGGALRDYHGIVQTDEFGRTKYKPELWDSLESKQKGNNSGYVHYWEAYIPKKSESILCGVVTDQQLRDHITKYGIEEWHTVSGKLDELLRTDEGAEGERKDIVSAAENARKIVLSRLNPEGKSFSDLIQDIEKVAHKGENNITGYAKELKDAWLAEYKGKGEYFPLGNIEVTKQGKDSAHYRVSLTTEGYLRVYFRNRADNTNEWCAEVTNDNPPRIKNLLKLEHNIPKGATMTNFGQSYFGGVYPAVSLTGVQVYGKTVDKEEMARDTQRTETAYKDTSAKGDTWIIKGALPMDPGQRMPVPEFNPEKKFIDSYKWLYREAEKLETNYASRLWRVVMGKNFVRKDDFEASRLQKPYNDWKPEKQKELLDDLEKKWNAIRASEGYDGKNLDEKALLVKRFQDEHVKKIWEDPLNAKQCYIHYGSVVRNAGGTIPHSVDRDGKLTEVYFGKDIREYRPSDAHELYLHASGDKTTSSKGLIMPGLGGNRPCHAKWDGVYFWDQDLFEFKLKNTPKWLAKKASALASDDRHIYDDQSYRFQNFTPLDVYAREIVAFAYGKDISAVSESDGTPSQAGGLTISLLNRQAWLGGENFVKGIGVTATAAAVTVVVGAVAMASFGLPLIVGGLISALPAIYGAKTAYQAFADGRQYKLDNYELLYNTDQSRLYKEPSSQKPYSGFGGLVEDWGMMWRGIRGMSFVFMENREKITNTKRYSGAAVVVGALAAVGAVVGAIVAGAVTAPLIACVAGGCVLSGAGMAGIEIAKVAEKGYVHFMADTFVRAGQRPNKSKTAYEGETPDIINRAGGFDLKREQPMAVEFIDKVEQLDMYGTASLGMGKRSRHGNPLFSQLDKVMGAKVPKDGCIATAAAGSSVDNKSMRQAAQSHNPQQAA